MSVKFILIVSWAMPLMLLGWILYGQFAATIPPADETNAKMRIRMCREHMDEARADPNDTIARQATEECVVAGYIRRHEGRTALD
jgi:hypothetical protein